MKILYGIQGTGHGHISRAREILPLLSEQADIDVLLSGYNCNMTLEDIQITQKRGISLAYDSNGSVSYLQTAMKIQPVTFLQDVNSLNVSDYDLVISDYEPITAWASLNAKVLSVGLSHQAAFLSEKSPRPKKKSLISEQILKHFAPCNRPVGFHFQRYDSFVLPPIIRKDVRELEVKNENHITVYLPAFDHETLVSIFSHCKQVDWHLFSPNCNNPYQKENVKVFPVGNKPFLESLKNSLGVVTSAGFETCAETMFLGKKLLVIPIKNQYEQLCNAAALQKMGVHVFKNLNADIKDKIIHWINDAPIVELSEAADTEHLTRKLVRFAERNKIKKFYSLSEKSPA
jgi:uncharacterized protein (TIGR00661 family)